MSIDSGSDAVIAIDDANSAIDADDSDSESSETSSPNVTDILVGTDSTSATVQDTQDATVQDTNINQQPDIQIQQPDIITITTDVISAVEEVVNEIIADTSAEVLIDMIAETSSQKDEVKEGVSEKADAGVDAEMDSQATKDTKVSPEDITQLDDGTTWYTSKVYQYKVQFPSWVEASQLKTTDLLLSGNSANQIGLTNQQLASTAHFTLRTEFEYYPEYMKYDAWWKNLYGKPDEAETYKGQTFQYHSADSGGGFNRYTYVKIGNVGALRIEMKFSMPEQLYVEGFEQKALEVLNMVTKSAQAVN
ncbi:MAG: hypothetical protein NTX63_00100 [Candidatus Peregrinibacteria bacterium]|nr:hypothetical protein [Candidatus Peregrinibacteria bacterium]